MFYKEDKGKAYYQAKGPDSSGWHLHPWRPLTLITQVNALI